MSRKKGVYDLGKNFELSLIFRIITLKEDPFSKEDKALLNHINWEKLLNLSVLHNVIPIIYKKLMTEDQNTVTENIIVAFKNLYHQIVQWSFVQSNQLTRVLKALEIEEIQAVPIKGPVLSVQAYGDIGYRMFQDLDLLIFPEDFIKVYDVLSSNGYQPAEELSGRRKKLWRRYRRDIEFQNNKTIIDLHQRYSQGSSSFDIDKKVLSRNQTIKILDHQIQVLSPEDTMIYLCINSTKDEWSKARMIADLSFLIRSNPDINWGVVLEKSAERGIQRMVLAGLRLLMKTTGEKLPELIAEKIEADPKIEYLSNIYINNLSAIQSDSKTKERIGSVLRAFDSPLFKVKYLLNFLLTPTPQDFHWILLPESLFFLYRFLRPVRLLTLALKNRKRV